MLGIGPTELIIILVTVLMIIGGILAIVLLIFGGSRLVGLRRNGGRAIDEDEAQGHLDGTVPGGKRPAQ